MAPAVSSSLPAGWAGWIIAALTILTAFIVNWRKGKIDQSALVLGEWKKLYDAHEKRVEALTAEISGLRERLTEAESRIRHLEEVVVQKDHAIIEKDKYIAGLEAQIGQITQSSAVILSGNHASPDVSEAAGRSAEERVKRKRRSQE
jgi:chromosome segregation ATPase